MPKKQKDGRYRAKIVVIKGEKPVWVSGRTLRELEENKRKVRENCIDGVIPRSVTFHALVIEWFETVKKPRIRTRSTLANYENAISLHLLPYFPPKQLVRAVRRADLQRCLDACAGLSVTPCKLVRSIISSVMKYALAERIIAVDPSVSLTLPACRQAGTKDAFTPGQVDQLLSAAAASPYGIMIYLLYFTGIRRGEMLGLQWGDFDWQNHLIHIQRSVDLSAQSGSFSALKTAASNRYVPIPDTLEAFLLPLRGKPDGLLVSLGDNQPLTAGVFRRRWKELMTQAGLPQITPHWFRHNYITACVAAGLPAEVTMRIVGHSSYRTTIDVYTHFHAEQFRKASISLAGVLCGDRCQKVANSAQPAEQ